MSNNDDDRDGAVLPFLPRAVLPGSLDDPGPALESGKASGPAEEDNGAHAPLADAMPRLPAVAEMRPPLHLTVPGVPDLAPASGDDEGAFTLPPPEDPDNPTARDTAAVAMALMTALGVAAAQGMWHRARHRQALADKARAGADKTSTKSAGDSGGARATRGAGGSGSSGSLLRSPGGEKKGGSRAFARRAGGGGGGGKQARHGKTPRGPKGGGLPKGPGGAPRGKGAPGSKSSRAARGGKPTPKGAGKTRRPQGGPAWLRRKGGAAGPAGTGDKPPKGKKSPKSGTAKAKRETAGGNKSTGSGQGRKLTWKAPKGSDKGGSAKRKRWTTGRTKPDGKSSKPKSRKRAGRRWVRKLTWKGKGGGVWWKRWRTRRTAEGAADPTFAEATEQETSTSTGSPDADHDTDGRERWTAGRDGARGWERSAPPPPPPPGWERMRPPPGADRSERVTVERVDGRPWPRPEAPALTVGQAALTAGPAESPAARRAPSSTSADQQGALIVSTPVRTTQYADADLTIHDVIDADADMAEEITDGVIDARATADGCERLLSKLEAVLAEVVDLKVPGVLAGMLALLMEKTATVKAKAEAIAANLPAAAEAISTAGSNAEARHKPLADAVRDAGHIRPAEREYHDE